MKLKILIILLLVTGLYANGTTKLKVSIKYHTTNGKTYFTGKTNLPDKTRIGIQLNDKASDFKIYIKSDGSYASAGFSNLGKPLVGKYKVEFMLYRNQSWQEKDILEKLKEYRGHGLEKGNASIIKMITFGSKKARRTQQDKINNMNPLKRIGAVKAEEDLEKNLRKHYSDESVILMLHRAEIRDFYILQKLPNSSVNNKILNSLLDSYYPSFSTILILYKAEIKNYKFAQ